MDVIKDWIKQLLLFTLKYFDESINGAAVILTQGVNFSSAKGMVSAIGTFASTIVVIACLIELCIGAARVDGLRWEHAVKIGTKLCLGKVCVDLGADVLEATYLQTQSWILTLAGNPANPNVNIISSTLSIDAKDCIDLLITKVSGFGGAMGLLATSLIMILAILICGLLIKVMAYARIFELYAYIAVSPLPLAFAPLGAGGDVGINNITKRFLKTYAGVCLQGVMMIIVLKIFDTLIENAIITKVGDMYNALSKTGATIDVGASLSELLTTMLLGSIALVVAVSKSGSWAKGIMDGA